MFEKYNLENLPIFKKYILRTGYKTSGPLEVFRRNYNAGPQLPEQVHRCSRECHAKGIYVVSDNKA